MFSKISFKLKLIFSFFFVVIISFGIVAFFLDRNLERNALVEIESSLINQARLVENQITKEKLKNRDFVFLEELVKKLSLAISCRITIIDNKGNVLADSGVTEAAIAKMENHLARPEIWLALTGGTGIETRYSQTLKKDMLYVALPIRDEKEITGALRLALPLDNVEKVLSTLRKTVLAGVIFALALCLLLSFIIVRSIANPVNKIILASRKISKGDFTHRIIQESKDEIGELADTLNKMSEDLEHKIGEIKNKNQQLEAVLNSMIEGVIVVDKAGRLVSINHSIENIFEITRQEIKGKEFLEVVRNNELFEIMNRVMARGEFVSSEIMLVWPVRKTFKVNATPIFNRERVSGCLIVIHDITEIRRLETVRSDFVANVSHELKTPLTSIKGFIETLLEGALDDKNNNRHFLEIIRDHTERLNNLVNDLLELSQIENREIELKISEVDFKGLCDKVLSGFKVAIGKREIKIENSLADSLLIRADKDKIEQVFTNLIDNAIKFNKEKGLIKIYSEEINENIKIVIEDSGIGIPTKDILRVFERFYRVDKARSRELGGTGLGLSIVKHIVELHGGTAGVESHEGLGSKFFFILPK